MVPVYASFRTVYAPGRAIGLTLKGWREQYSAPIAKAKNWELLVITTLDDPATKPKVATRSYRDFPRQTH